MCMPLLVTLLIAAVVMPAVADAGDPERQPLFDGKSLDGWVRRGGGCTAS